MKWWAGSLQIAISPAKFWNRLLSTDQLDPLQNDLPQKYEAGNSWNFNSTKWFSYPSFQLKVKIIDCLQNDGTWFFSTKRLGFYVLQGSMLLSFIQKTVKKTICSEHESYQMVEDMATPIPMPSVDPQFQATVQTYQDVSSWQLHTHSRGLQTSASIIFTFHCSQWLNSVSN